METSLKESQLRVNFANELSSPSYHHSFLAGGFAHSCELLMLGQCLDRIKVEQEIRADLNIRDAIASIWKQGQWESFYRGLKWNLISSALKGSFGWSLHNLSNRFVMSIYAQKDPKHPSFYFSVLVGAGVAFLETSLILCPLERLKTFEMTNHSKVNDYIKKKSLSFFFRDGVV